MVKYKYVYTVPHFQVEHYLEMSEETFNKLCMLTKKRYGYKKMTFKNKSRVIADLIKKAHKVECGKGAGAGK